MEPQDIRYSCRSDPTQEGTASCSKHDSLTSLSFVASWEARRRKEHERQKKEYIVTGKEKERKEKGKTMKTVEDEKREIKDKKG